MPEASPRDPAVERAARAFDSFMRERACGRQAAFADVDAQVWRWLTDYVVANSADFWPGAKTPGGELTFRGRSYRLCVERAWNREAVVVRFEPAGVPWVEDGFSHDIPVTGCAFTRTLRLYPPRSDVMFEFHTPRLARVVQVIAHAAEAGSTSHNP